MNWQYPFARLFQILLKVTAFSHFERAWYRLRKGKELEFSHQLNLNGMNPLKKIIQNVP